VDHQGERTHRKQGLVPVARDIIDSNADLTLATADENGLLAVRRHQKKVDRDHDWSCPSRSRDPAVPEPPGWVRATRGYRKLRCWVLTLLEVPEVVRGREGSARRTLARLSGVKYDGAVLSCIRATATWTGIP
jgi:hypothetical protein